MRTERNHLTMRSANLRALTKKIVLVLPSQISRSGLQMGKSPKGATSMEIFLPRILLIGPTPMFGHLILILHTDLKFTQRMANVAFVASNV